MNLDLGQVVIMRRQSWSVAMASGIRTPEQEWTCTGISGISFLSEFVIMAGAVHALRDDVIECGAHAGSPTHSRSNLVDLVLEKCRRLQAMTTKPEFDPLIVGFKRAHRLGRERTVGSQAGRPEARFLDTATESASVRMPFRRNNGVR